MWVAYTIIGIEMQIDCALGAKKRMTEATMKKANKKLNQLF